MIPEPFCFVWWIPRYLISFEKVEIVLIQLWLGSFDEKSFDRPDFDFTFVGLESILNCFRAKSENKQLY